MKMEPVKSSQVRAVGYEPETRTLAVQYANGGTYHYHSVVPDVYQSLLKAESIGKFLNARIKGKHRHTKVGK